MSQIAPMQMPQYQGPVGGGAPSDDAELAGIISAIGGAAGGIGQASYAAGKAGPSPALDSSGGAPIGQAAQYIEPGTNPGAAKPQTQLGSMLFAGSGSANSPTGVSEVQLPVIQSLKSNSTAAQASGALGIGGLATQSNPKQYAAGEAAGGLASGLLGQGGLGRSVLGGSLGLPLQAGGGLVGNLLPYAASYYARDKFA